MPAPRRSRMLRFGVMDAATRAHSAYWKLGAAAGRPDVYLSCAGLAFLHLSLHEHTPSWHVRVEHDGRIDDSPIPVPVEFAPGYVHAVEIRVPPRVVDEISPPRPGVVWVRAPYHDPARWVRFHVVLQPSGADPAQWPGMKHGDGLVGRVPMADGRTACVTASITGPLEVKLTLPTTTDDELRKAVGATVEGDHQVDTVAWGYSPEVGVWVMVGRAELAPGPPGFGPSPQGSAGDVMHG